MPIYPLYIALVIAIVDWVAVEKHWRVVEYIAKPATMLALLGWIWISTGFTGLMLWFTLGIICCLAGDIFLMIPRDLFIFGLVAFLLGHVSYIIGLNDKPPYINWLGIIVIIFLVVYIGWLYPKLVSSLKKVGKGKLSAPVLIYSLVISIMVYSAIMTLSRPGWSQTAALAASVGAVLFFASDSILAWDRFINHLPHGRLVNMIAYHLGQFLIILGSLLHALAI